MNTNNRIYMKFALVLSLVFTFCFANAQVTVSGTIKNEFGDPIENVPVRLDGITNDFALTNEDGLYEFNIDPADAGNYVITPSSNADVLNGVSTFDLLLLRNHIMGIELLDSPYSIIAADIDNSGTVDGLDTIAIMDVITWEIQNFPNNNSWRFVSADFIFPNSSDPFETAFPEVSSVLVDQDDVTGVDFTGIKIGDLNNTAFLLLSDSPCDYLCGELSGNVYYDLDENCSLDMGEEGLQQWVVTASTNSGTFNTLTDIYGNYSLSLFPATYEVSLSLPNTLWSPCESSYSVTLDSLEEVSLDIPVKAVGSCPAMEVNLGTPFLRRCFESFYVIQYCNQGTEIANDASVEVTFDSFLMVTNTSIPWTSQNGNTYTFDLGDVGVNECGSIEVELEISCDAILGETFCTEAHIFPDTICVPPSNLWDGSDLELWAHCEADSVRFEVRNIGSPMTESVNYIVIEDDMIMMTGDNDPIQLQAQESRFLNFPANGSTWRLELDQSSNHPLNEMLSAAIEGCGENGSGEFSLGFITQFPQYTESPAVDVDCVEGIGSWDPNDKSAIPEGVGAEHFIERNTDLEYRIRFQNTGTDTAFTVVIRDTLSEWLNPTSIRVGAASHDFEYQFVEDNIIEFLFQNIMLPDSNVNEVASHGFLKFNIAQKANNPLGTVIENDAAIYFDFNEPVITNTTFHTIGEDFLDVLNHNIVLPGQSFDVKVYPNPVGTFATLQLEGLNLKNGNFILYDLYGRLLRNQSFNGNSLEFYKGELTEGMYLFEIHEDGQRLSSGKLMVK